MGINQVNILKECNGRAQARVGQDRPVSSTKTYAPVVRFNEERVVVLVSEFPVRHPEMTLDYALFDEPGHHARKRLILTRVEKIHLRDQRMKSLPVEVTERRADDAAFGLRSVDDDRQESQSRPRRLGSRSMIQSAGWRDRIDK